MNSDSLITSVTTVALAIVGIGFLAVLLGKNSQTGPVISALGSAFTGGIAAAQGPVSGSSSLSALLG